ncbi:glycoside hydrolase family 1 protein [Atopobacter sp. AH10]|uniref:glycoside hydrolase family 1 protein n=1 Tax=Atopobacter sp. AH10 TaxID=2315861 RepID=UPI000EF22467|nr:glycoside hydrolase family 1 protein [Atopobacter sp. AH10]RLK63454.1 glycoside hydrolase family 1 protein [Atopobacter sp. AH10]
MSKSSYFPKEFLFGSAAAAYHFEGGFGKDGKGASVADVIPHAPSEGRTTVPEDGNLKHRAVEFYERYKDDVKLFGELGLKAFRTSIAWTRIYPKGIEEEPNEKGLQFYDDLFDALHEQGIEPIITITHSAEMPLYLAEHYNGFANKKVIEFYLKYVRTVVNRYKGKVKYWLTFNEVNIVAHEPFFHAGVAQYKEPVDDNLKYQIFHNMFVANSKAIRIIKEIEPDAMVGCTTTIGPIYPLTPKPEDGLQAYFDMREMLFHIDVHVFGKYPDYKLKEFKEKKLKLDITDEELQIIKENTVDFVAYSYYMSGVSSFNRSNSKVRDVNIISKMSNPELKKNEWGWTYDPVGLRTILNIVWDRYRLPEFIVENGISKPENLEIGINGQLTVYDDYRIEGLRDYLLQINEAIHDGVQVIGYTNWAVMDFVSGSTGTMRKRWGFIFVDYYDDKTGSMKRFKKLSFDWYRKVIDSNGAFLFEEKQY